MGLSARSPKKSRKGFPGLLAPGGRKSQKKIENGVKNLKIVDLKRYRNLRNDFRAGTVPAQITEMGSAEKSFFEGHEVILISGDAATSGTNHRNAPAQEFPIFQNFP